MNKSISTTVARSFAERLWPGFSWVVCLYFATILVFDRVVYALLAMIAVGIAFTALYAYRPRLDKELRFLGLVLIANLLLALPNIVLARDGLLSLENPVRILLMLPLILAVTRFGLNTRFICIGLATGMLAAAPVIGWQYHVLEVSRPGIHYNPILFSEVAMSAFAVLLAACLVIQDRLVPLYLAGLLAALYCVILSGARGTLIAFAPIIIFLLWWGWRRGAGSEILSGRRILLFPVILLFLGTVLISNDHFIDRVRLAVSQTTDYFEKGDASTSVGLRLEFWKSSWMVGLEHPFLGIGERQRQAFVEEKISRGELKPEMATMRNAHNDYLHALQSRGIPGLILLLLIYALPMLIFLRGLATTKDEQLFAALGGALMTVGYATFSLTEVPMYDGLNLIFYIVTTSLFIGIIKHSKSTSSADHPR